MRTDKDGDCARYAATRLIFSDKTTVRFEEALIGNEDFDEQETKSYFGFRVEAGLACICDKKLHKVSCDFSEKRKKEHTADNLYNAYFTPLFAENYKAPPEFQRKS